MENNVKVNDPKDNPKDNTNQSEQLVAEAAKVLGPSISTKEDGFKEVPFDPRYWTQRISEYCGEQEGKDKPAWEAAKAHIDTALYKMNQILNK